MSIQHHTRAGRSFDEWLADCSTWWDMTMGEEAHDYPWLEWQDWYREGLTVEDAVRRAHARVFGGPGE
jgi:hypothetical protein